MRYGELTPVLCLVAALAVTEDAPGKVYGHWQGETHGQPSVELTVRQGQGRPEGRIVFNLLHLEDGKWVRKGRTEKELLSPRWEGKVLVFEVEHATKHGSPERGPNMRFRLEAKSDDRALLKHLDGGDTTELRRVSEQ